MPSATARSVPVVIVGAGPVGLALALGLARHGVDSMVLEQDQGTSRYSKAAGLHVRTREILRRWGVEDRFLDAGNLVSDIILRDVAADERALLRFDFAALDGEADHPGLLVLEQSETERLLLDEVRRSGRSEVIFGAEVTSLRYDRDRVQVVYRYEGGAQQLETSYLVGCDGASSFVRDAVGLPFEGRTYRLRPMLADVILDDDRDELPWPRVQDREGGFTVALRLRAGLWRIIHLGDVAEEDGDDVPEQEVRRRVRAVLGPGPVDIVWSSRFRIHRRSSPRFRQGRILLAGDAAHVHSPVGGQGMNAGVQDAADLAWKLAGALHGGEVERLLGSYESERRAVVVGEVSRFTDLLTRLYLQVPAWVRRVGFAAQRAAFRSARLRRAALRRLSMLDLTVPASPLLDADERSAGIRLPDPRVVAPDGTRHRLHALLPVGAALVRVSDDDADGGLRAEDLPVDAIMHVGRGGWEDRSGSIRALLGGEDGWVLVRPDGYVSWARTGENGLAAAVRSSLGRPG